MQTIDKFESSQSYRQLDMQEIRHHFITAYLYPMECIWCGGNSTTAHYFHILLVYVSRIRPSVLSLFRINFWNFEFL